MALPRRSRALTLLSGLTLLVSASACSSSDDASPAPSEAATSDDGAVSPPVASDEEALEPEEAAGGEYTPDDIGSAVLWIDGVEHPNFLGDCEISRENGREDVGDISTPGLVVIVAVDNVASGPESEMNFVMLNESSFRINQMTGPVSGSITGTAYASGLTPKGSTQAIALVEFTGTSEEGTPLRAEIVCEIQNKF